MGLVGGAFASTADRSMRRMNWSRVTPRARLATINRAVSADACHLDAASNLSGRAGASLARQEQAQGKARAAVEQHMDAEEQAEHPEA